MLGSSSSTGRAEVTVTPHAVLFFPHLCFVCLFVVSVDRWVVVLYTQKAQQPSALTPRAWSLLQHKCHPLYHKPPMCFLSLENLLLDTTFKNFAVGNGIAWISEPIILRFTFN